MERHAYSFLGTLNIANISPPKPLTLSLSYKFNAMVTLTPTSFCMEFVKLILIFMWKIKGPRMYKIFLKKNKERLVFPILRLIINL